MKYSVPINRERFPNESFRVLVEHLGWDFTQTETEWQVEVPEGEEDLFEMMLEK